MGTTYAGCPSRDFDAAIDPQPRRVGVSSSNAVTLGALISVAEATRSRAENLQCRHFRFAEHEKLWRSRLGGAGSKGSAGNHAQASHSRQTLRSRARSSAGGCATFQIEACGNTADRSRRRLARRSSRRGTHRPLLRMVFVIPTTPRVSAGPATLGIARNRCARHRTVDRAARWRRARSDRPRSEGQRPSGEVTG